MDKQTVDLINELSEIYASIQERVINEGEFLESDNMFVKFYNNFIDLCFGVKKENKENEQLF